MSKKQPTDADRLKSEIAHFIKEERAERNREQFEFWEIYRVRKPEQEAECYRERRGTLADDLLDTKEPSPTTSDKD